MWEDKEEKGDQEDKEEGLQTVAKWEACKVMNPRQRKENKRKTDNSEVRIGFWCIQRRNRCVRRCEKRREAEEREEN